MKKTITIKSENPNVYSDILVTYDYYKACAIRGAMKKIMVDNPSLISMCNIFDADVEFVSEEEQKVEKRKRKQIQYN